MHVNRQWRVLKYVAAYGCYMGIWVVAAYGC